MGTPFPGVPTGNEHCHHVGLSAHGEFNVNFGY